MVLHVLDVKKKEIIFSLGITIFIIFLSAIVLYLVEGKNQQEKRRNEGHVNSWIGQ